MPSLKERLHSLCIAHVQQRIDTADEAIRSAQASANEETKSSAGDKYETGRAMAQLEIEKNTAQLAESTKLMHALQQIQLKVNESVQSGSLVYTNQGCFYLSVSAGKFEIDGKTLFAISPAAPIGQRLMGCMKNDSFTFNGKVYTVSEIE